MISDGYISNFTAFVHIGNFSSIQGGFTFIAGRDLASSERNKVLTESLKQCVLCTKCILCQIHGFLPGLFKQSH